ncbi:MULTISPECIES: DUF6085 family protein [unclassified Streptomyces]|uniref:DUF6085 family protein n=1 Tax=unclassified Streptomyces TaxID=2593676 RepID=UPI00136C0AAF|nr:MULTISPECIES: DUF6085 family protein [unclassified Streptomyces]NDZ98552.1 hypothetical protein [Streptomyces sp. SID10116]MYY79722.1 hypothetical protein [Streptomyces sp. SID335]MYZ12804.1 hypothetical protein [Streptomyces sp. SID337]NDZ84541.1 hypothetical protein [Streptomyces sp. SID10115]NEB43505.1 hypothetical protein [Streptomyces sp. SID339]
MTDTPTPPQAAPEAAQSAPHGSGGPGLPPRGPQAPQKAVEGFDVQGCCPACRGTSLMLADGGHVTCRRLDCPNPSAADQLLHGEPQPRLAAAADREEQAARLTPGGRDECRAAHSGRAAGLRDAARILGGHDGPSITECAANDRRWDLEKAGE